MKKRILLVVTVLIVTCLAGAYAYSNQGEEAEKATQAKKIVKINKDTKGTFRERDFGDQYVERTTKALSYDIVLYQMNLKDETLFIIGEKNNKEQGYSYKTYVTKDTTVKPLYITEDYLVLDKGENMVTIKIKDLKEHKTYFEERDLQNK